MNCEILTKKGEKLTLYFEGRIDANNAPDVEVEVFKILKDNDLKVIFDFTKLEYISSAGLRVLLKVKKIIPDIKIIEVSDEVYDVFEMTGFTTMLDITKKLRIVDTAGLTPVGEGAVGKVFRLDDERIIKVFKRAGCIDDVYRERNMSKKAFMVGVPTAISYEIVKTQDGYYGSIFELLKSELFNSFFIKDPENTDKYIKMYADLINTVITTEVAEGSLPDKKVHALEIIETVRKHEYVEPEIIDKIEMMIQTLPNTHTMVHGDIHIKNIMMQNGEPILIDMETIGAGHPIFEFSPIWLVYYCYPATSDEGDAFLRVPMPIQHRIYDKMFADIYKNKTPEELHTAKEKIILWGCMDMLYRVVVDEDANNDRRVKYCVNIIHNLINKYDSLNF